MVLKIWSDKKRYLGLPISFTKYSVSMDRLFVETGIFTRIHEQLLLYRIRDISTKVSLFQRIFKVGTIKITSTDKSEGMVYLKNIKNPMAITELLHKQVEIAKKERGMKVGEIMESNYDEYEEMEAAE